MSGWNCPVFPSALLRHEGCCYSLAFRCQLEGRQSPLMWGVSLAPMLVYRHTTTTLGGGYLLLNTLCSGRGVSSRVDLQGGEGLDNSPPTAVALFTYCPIHPLPQLLEKFPLLDYREPRKQECRSPVSVGMPRLQGLRPWFCCSRLWC